MIVGRRIWALAIVALVIGSALIAVAPRARAATVPNGPWLDRVVWSVNGDASQALTDIIEGNTDLFDFSLQGPTDKLRARSSFDVSTIETYGSVDGFVFNPMPQADGSFNPFTLREVREAMQYLVDRDLIGREILGGFYIPYVTPFHPKSADYGRFIDTEVTMEDRYVTNPQRAKQLIDTAMAAAGATKNAQGKWVRNSVPVEIVVWARVEDERLAIGQYLGTLLDGMGFTVTVQPVDRTFIAEVYEGPPDQGLWHVYTEGWSFTANVFLDDIQLYDFHACYWEIWCEAFPTQNGYAPPTALVDATEAVAFGEYTSLQDREDKIRSSIPIAMSESYRMWLVAEAAVFPVSSRMSVAYDLFGGPHAEIASRTAKISGQTCLYDGGTTCTGRFVNFLPGQQAWNPWPVASETLYDALQMDMFRDFGMLRHPHRGQLIDNRNAVTVTTTGPTGTPLSVPATAVKYNTTSGAWEAIGSGVTATSKATITPTFGPWHHGPAMTMDDVKAWIALTWRMAFGDISQSLPSAVSSGDKSFMAKYKGFSFTGSSYDVYIDYFSYDTQDIAGAAEWWPWAPWEVQELAAQGFLDNETANSKADSQTLARVWLDLTKGDSLPILAADLAALKAASAVPPGSGISAATADARWTALETWATTYAHYWPSNGPYFLVSVDPAFGTSVLDAFRQYPFPADYYDYLRVPRIPSIQFSSLPSVVFSGTPGLFDFSSTVAGAPYDNITTVWYLKDLSNGTILTTGTSTRLGSGAYRVELSAALTEQLLFGNFQLLLVVASEDASVPTIVKPTFLVLPSVDYFEGLVSATESALQADIDALEQQQGSLRDSLDANTAATQSVASQVTILTALAVVAVIISVVTLLRALRRPPGKAAAKEAGALEKEETEELP